MKKHSEIYKFFIDRDKHETKDRYTTLRAILLLAGIAEADFNTKAVYAKSPGQSKVKLTDLDEQIDLAEKGIERFRILPNDLTEGEAPSVFPFLTDDDRVFLSELTHDYEIIPEGRVHWLVIKNFPIPEGYNVSHSDLSIRIEPNYPEQQLDMAYFAENLSLLSGKAIKALAPATHLGRNWQRWSRHRTPQNPWRVGVDGLETHVWQIDEFLKREL